MKITIGIITLSSVVLLDGIAAQAQMQPGMIDMTPSINASITNYNHDRLMETMKGRNGGGGKTAAMVELERMERIGAARIKAGKATVTFAPTVAATQAVAKSMTWDEQQPTLQSQIAYIQKNVRMFNKLMTQNGFAVNDFADGYAFAYALSYAAYYNKDMDKAEVERIRSERRNALLDMPSFQGDTDLSKQYLYEQNAMMAMQAAEFRARYRLSTDEVERQKYNAQAKSYANYLLKIKP